MHNEAAYDGRPDTEHSTMELTRERLKVAMTLGAAASCVSTFTISKRAGLRLRDVEDACQWLVSIKCAYALSETTFHAASDDVAHLIRTCR